MSVGKIVYNTAVLFDRITINKLFIPYQTFGNRYEFGVTTLLERGHNSHYCVADFQIAFDFYAFGNDFSTKVAAQRQRKFHRSVHGQLPCLPDGAQQHLAETLWKDVSCRVTGFTRACCTRSLGLTGHEGIERINGRRFDAYQHVLGSHHDGRPGVAGQHQIVDATVRMCLPRDHLGRPRSVGRDRVGNNVGGHVVAEVRGRGERTVCGPRDHRVLRR